MTRNKQTADCNVQSLFKSLLSVFENFNNEIRQQMYTVRHPAALLSKHYLLTYLQGQWKTLFTWCWTGLSVVDTQQRYLYHYVSQSPVYQTEVSRCTTDSHIHTTRALKSREISCEVLVLSLICGTNVAYLVIQYSHEQYVVCVRLVV